MLITYQAKRPGSKNNEDTLVKRQKKLNTATQFVRSWSYSYTGIACVEGYRDMTTQRQLFTYGKGAPHRSVSLGKIIKQFISMSLCMSKIKCERIALSPEKTESCDPHFLEKINTLYTGYFQCL